MPNLYPYISQKDHKTRKLVIKECKNPQCSHKFEVKPYDTKIFCSKHCAVLVNNQGRKLSRETKLKIANSLSKIPVKFLKSELPKRTKETVAPFVITKEELEGLYLNKELSSSDISRKYKVSVWQVIKRLRKYNIPRRTPWETNNLKYARKSPSYNFKTDLTSEEKLLYNSAIMLYWGEGAKSQGTSVDFANSDKRMVVIFLRALREIFRIDESKLRGHLYCYGDQNVRELENYWSNLLNIPLNKFMKSYVRHDFDPKKKNKLPHGVMHVIYHDKKMYMQIMNEIDIITR